MWHQIVGVPMGTVIKISLLTTSQRACYTCSLGWFYVISTIVDYLMPNSVYTYILDIYDL